MELQRNLEKVRAQGLGVAAISYDPVATLEDFANRHGITYPLVSDRGSTIIRAFGILNTEVPADSPAAGIPYPGTYIVDREGRVLAKYFEENLTHRYMTSEILVRQFGAAAGAAQTTVRTRHLTVTAAASSALVRSGQRIALTVDIEMNPNMHVYAPGVSGYIPIEWSIAASPAVTVHPLDFPKPRILRLEAIGETVPVYNGEFRLVRDVTVGEVRPGPLVIAGSLKYQACDDRKCYVPQTVPLEWAIQVEPHERGRPSVPFERRTQ